MDGVGYGRTGGRIYRHTIILCLACLLLCLTLVLAACRRDDTPTGDGLSAPASSTVTVPPAESTGEPGTESPTDPSVDVPGDTSNDTANDTSIDIPGDTTDPADTDKGEVITLPEPTVPEPDKTPAEMPRLDIRTEGSTGIGSNQVYTRSTLTLSGCHQAYAFTDVAAGVRIRGNSTAVAPKKPYRIQFDTKQAMLGLSGGRAYRSWCLMADYYDGSMLRTYGTFRLAKALLDGNYFSADCTHVEVYVDGSYQGVYLLCDQTQIKTGRVNIPEMSPGDTSPEQGYLLIGQGGRTDEPGTVQIHPNITVKDRNGRTMHFGTMNFALSGGDFTDEQKQYVSAYVSGVFQVVARAVYDREYYSLSRSGELIPKTDFDWAVTDEEKQMETVGAVFNIEAAVVMCILDELVKNLDAMTFNMYVDLSPTGDGILTLAAPWDFDFSMANTHYTSTHTPTGFYATNLSYSDGMRTNLWYVMMGSIPWFEEMVKETWQENLVEIRTVVSDMIGTNYAYDQAFTRDFETWGLPADRMLIGHHDTADLATFDTHLKAGTFVTDWLTARIDWLDSRWGTDPTPDDNTPPPNADALKLTFDHPGSTALITGESRCDVVLTDEGLSLSPAAGHGGHDPYFSFDYHLLADIYEAEDFPYVEFTYMIPTTASQDSFDTELFLCTGSVAGATGGISTHVTTLADGQWHTVRLDLLATGFWSGTIHSIRFDFFTGCMEGDVMYLKNFHLLTE